MKSSVFKEIILPVLSLFSICLVCSALLGLTNNATKDIIIQRQEDDENNSRIAVVNGASSFSDVLKINVDEHEYTYYEALEDDESVMAYIFATTANGYGGEVKVLTGISADGLVTGVIPVTLNETPGLGMKVGNDDYLNQYIGKSENIKVVKNNPSEQDIQAITGATISSNAVTDAVNTAFEVYNAVKEVNTNG